MTTINVVVETPETEIHTINVLIDGIKTFVTNKNPANRCRADIDEDSMEAATSTKETTAAPGPVEEPEIVVETLDDST